MSRDLRQRHGPRDAADDNYNSFDPFPIPPRPIRTGEVDDSDFYDAAGALLLPVERMRRFVTPVDINGTGSVVAVDQGSPQARANAPGPTRWAGSSSTATSVRPARRDRSPRRRPSLPRSPGAIYYPSDSDNTYFYTNGPDNNRGTHAGSPGRTGLPPRRDQQPAARLRVLPAAPTHQRYARGPRASRRASRSSSWSATERRRCRSPAACGPPHERRRSQLPDPVPDLRLPGQLVASIPTA